MEVTAAMVKELRDDTGVPMMDCKKALVESAGDVERAKQLLRERGVAVAVKRAGREASAGVIASAETGDRRKAALVALGCETDFVARNPDFVQLAQQIADVALTSANDGATREEVLALSLAGGTVEAAITSAVGKIGEKIELGNVKVRQAPEGLVDTYIHHDKTKGVLVELGGITSDAAVELAHQIGIHVAWAAPEFVSRDDVDQDRLKRELEIEKARAMNDGKPEAAAEQIAQGRVNKNFLQAVCLLEQGYLGQSQTVREMVEKVPGVSVVGFTRFAVGG